MGDSAGILSTLSFLCIDGASPDELSVLQRIQRPDYSRVQLPPGVCCDKQIPVAPSSSPSETAETLDSSSVAADASMFCGQHPAVSCRLPPEGIEMCDDTCSMAGGYGAAPAAAVTHVYAGGGAGGYVLPSASCDQLSAAHSTPSGPTGGAGVMNHASSCNAGYPMAPMCFAPFRMYLMNYGASSAGFPANMPDPMYPHVCAPQFACSHPPPPCAPLTDGSPINASGSQVMFEAEPQSRRRQRKMEPQSGKMTAQMATGSPLVTYNCPPSPAYPPVITPFAHHQPCLPHHPPPLPSTYLPDSLHSPLQQQQQQHSPVSGQHMYTSFPPPLFSPALRPPAFLHPPPMSPYSLPQQSPTDWPRDAAHQPYGQDSPQSCRSDTCSPSALSLPHSADQADIPTTAAPASDDNADNEDVVEQYTESERLPSDQRYDDDTQEEPGQQLQFGFGVPVLRSSGHNSAVQIMSSTQLPAHSTARASLPPVSSSTASVESGAREDNGADGAACQSRQQLSNMGDSFASQFHTTAQSGGRNTVTTTCTDAPLSHTQAITTITSTAAPRCHDSHSDHTVIVNGEFPGLGEHAVAAAPSPAVTTAATTRSSSPVRPVRAWASLLRPATVATSCSSSSAATVSTNTASSSGMATATVLSSCQQQKATTSKHVDDRLAALAALLASHQLDMKPAPLQPRGLTNKSNWCYVNATLQALLHCAPFYRLLKQLPPPAIVPLRTSSAADTPRTPITDALLRLVAEFPLLTEPRPSVPRRERALLRDVAVSPAVQPDYVYAVLTDVGGDAFRVAGRQEDAEEFLTCLLSGLHDEMALLAATCCNGTARDQQQEEQQQEEQEEQEEDDDEDQWRTIVGRQRDGQLTRSAALKPTPISVIFAGQLRRSLHRAGSKTTASVQSFFSLQLDIQHERVSSVQDALHALTSREAVDGVTCPVSGQPVPASQQAALEQLPPTLILHLKRFVFDLAATSDAVQKLHKPINFPVDLELDKDWLSPTLRSGRHGVISGGGGGLRYRLFAVVCHDGRHSSKGHYICHAFHPAHRQWLRYDDCCVSALSENAVLRPDPPLVPYILFYQRRTATTHHPHNPSPHQRQHHSLKTHTGNKHRRRSSQHVPA